MSLKCLLDRCYASGLSLYVRRYIFRDVANAIIISEPPVKFGIIKGGWKKLFEMGVKRKMGWGRD